MRKKLYTILVLFFCCVAFAAASDTLYYEQGKMKSPGLATLFSVLVPGTGQMYNGKWVKGGLFFTANTAAAGSAAYYYIRYAEYKDLYGIDNVMTQEALIYAKRITWFSAAIYVYNIIDAYVDAHLSAFPDERLILEPNPENPGVRLSLNF